MRTGSPRIDRIEQTEHGLMVWLSGSPHALEMPWFWVKDHSQDPTSIDVSTRQRTIDSFEIDRAIQAENCEIVGDEIHIHWVDGGASAVLPVSLLSDVAGPISTTAVPWSTADSLAVTPIGFDEVIGSDAGLRRWVQAVAVNGFGLVTGTPGDIESATALADRVGYVRRTIFGDVWVLSSDEVDHADSAYSTTYLEPHTDGTYAQRRPGTATVRLCRSNRDRR